MNQTEKIDKAAILHIPLSQYAFATSEYSITIRLRAKKSDLTRCVLYTADRVCRETPVCFSGTDMRVCATDECFDYYEADLTLPYNRVCYYFKLERERSGLTFMRTALRKSFRTEQRTEY